MTSDFQFLAAKLYARVPDCRFASNRTVAVRLRGESQQPLVCCQHGKQNLFFNQRRQIKRSR